MNTRLQMTIIWSIPVGALILTVGFLMAGLLPPPRASLSANELAAFYQRHTDVKRMGLVLMFTGCIFWGPMVGLIAQQMLRIRQADRLLSQIQLVAGAVAWVFLLMPILMLAAATFRPGRSPETTQTLHDLAWIVFLAPYVPFLVMNLSIASAIFADDADEPLFPRWLGYLQIWVGLMFVPAVVLLFFKSGAFSYQGLFPFWLPLTVFFIWLVAMVWALRRAVLSGADAAPGHATLREPATVGQP